MRSGTPVNPNAYTIILKSAGAMLLFAGCGAWSSTFYADRGLAVNLIGLPFALLVALLTARGWLTLAEVAIIACAWPVSRLVAIWGAMALDSNYLPMGLGGLAGALGVAVGVGVARRHMLSIWRLAPGAVVGFLAALSFGSWLMSFRSHLNTAPDPQQSARLHYAFAIWQAAVGTYIYTASKEDL